MVHLQNGTLTKWYTYKMVHLQNGTLTNWNNKLNYSWFEIDLMATG